MKVGAKWVSKGQICTMAGSSVFGIGCKIYENVFHFIMEECNQTLSDLLYRSLNNEPDSWYNQEMAMSMHLLKSL